MPGHSPASKDPQPLHPYVPALAKNRSRTPIPFSPVHPRSTVHRLQAPHGSSADLRFFPQVWSPVPPPAHHSASPSPPISPPHAMLFLQPARYTLPPYLPGRCPAHI